MAASEISEPEWSRVTSNLNINAIAGGGSGTRSALPYVAVSLGKVSHRSGGCKVGSFRSRTVGTIFFL